MKMNEIITQTAVIKNCIVMDAVHFQSTIEIIKKALWKKYPLSEWIYKFNLVSYHLPAEGIVRWEIAFEDTYFGRWICGTTDYKNADGLFYTYIDYDNITCTKPDWIAY